ncbi:MAG: methylmalonyl Co-A mutase-associated GTPase MeaB [Rhodocyclales bacterium]|nr:methylmalonyl Co-A mutase-associated GTPase MeaB [Rhodocyclales bacterium]
MSHSLPQLSASLLAGDKPALARALSLAERDPAAAAGLMRQLSASSGHAHVLGITGPPGAGKSTLVGALLRILLGKGMGVAVLAVDPSSPVSGGALLGDRFRIGEAAAGRCFIRSTATRGSLGGLTAAARQMVRLMDLAGYDLVIVETVGTGQSEIDVATLSDTLAVVFPPALGDEMQAIKAGILELADLLVVTKSDTPAAAQACQSLASAAHLWRRAPPVHAVSALSGHGLEELVAAVLQRVGEKASSRRERDAGLADSSATLAANLDHMWGQLLQRMPELAGLSCETGEHHGEVLRFRVLPRGVGCGFLLGQLAGALIMLADIRGLRITIARIDPRGTELGLELRRAG